MTAIALKRETDSYWDLIKDAGNEVKLALIKKLSDALKPAVAEKKPRKKKYTVDDFAGGWSDEYFMDVDELNKLIRDGRHVKSNRDKIWDEL
jgi:hypothetical protein